MGNRAPTKESNNEELGDNPSETASGVFLTEGLQNKILQEFQSEVLKTEWEKHQKYVIAKGNQRRLEEFQTKEHIVKELNEFRPQNQHLQAQLDQRTDELKAKFSDIATATKFDADRLQNKMKSQKFEAIETPCLMARSNVTLCLSENQGKELSRKCGDFVKALEDCAQRNIVTKQ